MGKTVELSPEVYQKLMEGFASEAWQTNDSWINDEKKFYMWLDTPDGRRRISYIHYTRQDGSGVVVSLSLKSKYGRNPVFQYEQIVRDSGEVEHWLNVAPYRDGYFEIGYTKLGMGIRYGADGLMVPGSMKPMSDRGVPRQIDMQATVERFLAQVSEQRFTNPILVLPK